MREGLIPTILGTVVSVAGASFSKNNMKKKTMLPMIEAGVVGFGLAHIVLGAIDLVEHRK
ncbi:asparagine synthase [Clostridium estertheticum]|uniref:Asparagine synthase n=2 Tax=Clostridium estertheticum TaxID=238834 RepID=A0A1J0GF13_9CLOT|nr:asparagine synthase [Clostridium estertheticum]APC39486.1 asparagine synthase [Clostridium estertheticum subsp. estertheticum]MBU3072166.1 asparagine synthase [Clostridium estertheticum]MBU3162258.1 asparagine synthase [Clostridium estertheticum]MBU3170689.1 asparagine synthase [Clostridium estertheticum]MBU3184680.1 asparagine synthase [Clostridium estertheticum]